ncbi:Lrp/AsnC family transcriptional regulator [Qipengyuania sphaerica]|uniref:Lrp/AsnC family transcriptional regulator n=1 Tax=Qipengyuania sphaerica TaxID=2867243 RepID=UPI001C882676|nr:Lrp/AsnC family transcriptional regulator [Qipengyuania sphaerica]MBX7539425.1 Lrp/AsnC family transcriptional regulator [Qipengyuania sphaerica]
MARAELDAKDRLLLASLQRDARASLVSLAREIGLSRSATHDRILRMEEAQVIRGYTVRLAEGALDAVRGFMTVCLEGAYARSDLTQEIAGFDGVLRAHCLTGDIDILVECAVADAAALASLRERIAELEGVERVTTRGVLASHAG